MRNPFYSKRALYIYSQPVSEPRTLDLPPGMECRPLTRQLIEKYFHSKSDYFRGLWYARLLGRGYEGVLVSAGDTWASVGWASTPDTPPPEHIPRSLVGRQYWLFGLHTANAYRRQGLANYLTSYSLEWVLQRSVSRPVEVFTDTDEENVFSRRSTLKQGFEPRGIMTVRTVSIPRLWSKSWGSWDRDATHSPLSSQPV